MASFRITTWDPILILAQIFSLQAIYYISFSFLLWVTLSLSGMSLTLDAIFQTTSLQTDNVFGWTLGFVSIINAVISIPLLVVIVQRAKQVLDFVVTLHGFHLVGCWLHSRRFPSTLTWWLVQFAALLIMTLGGEWACMRYEMKPILLNGGGNQNGADSDNRANKKNSMEDGVFSETYEDSLNHSENDPSSSSIQGTQMKKSKRKTSDAERQSQGQEGPLINMVGLAKKKILDKSQIWVSAAEDSKEYEAIPMNNVDNR